jgi:hypothetical protein
MHLRSSSLASLSPACWLPAFHRLARRWTRRSRVPAAEQARPGRLRPTFEPFEERFSPDDLFGLVRPALLGTGVSLLFGDLLQAAPQAPTVQVIADLPPSSSILGGATATGTGDSGTSVTTAADGAPLGQPSTVTPLTNATAAPPTVDPTVDPFAALFAAAQAARSGGADSASLNSQPVAADAGGGGIGATNPGHPANGTVTSTPSSSALDEQPFLPSSTSASPAPTSQPRATLRRSATPGIVSAPPSPLPRATSTPAATPLVPGPTPPTPLPPQPILDQQLAHTPIAFEPNVGQTNSQALFLSHNAGLNLFLTADSAVLSLARSGPATTPAVRDVLRFQLAGANSHAAVVGQQELASRSNYFGDPNGTHADVPQLAQVTYQNIYPGIDLTYYGNSQHQLEYDFVVAPGADPSAIHLNIQGAQGLSVDGQGNLVIQTDGGTLVQQSPTLYQTVDGVRHNVAGAAVLNADGSVSFRPGAYDPSRPLDIDPVLAFSTYLGGSGDDKAYGVAVDLAGDTFVTGSTWSSDFPCPTDGN